MSFVEFIARLECKDFYKLEKEWLDWAHKLVDSYQEILKLDVPHNGDCTNQSWTCDYCLLETLLKEYREYSLNSEKFIKENGL